MGKTKNKNSSEIRYLQGENKRLMKQVKRLERMIEKYNWLELPPEEELDAVAVPITIKKHSCPDCIDGKLKEMEVVGRKFMICDSCDYRKKVE